MKWTASAVAHALGSASGSDLQFSDIATDTRSLRPESLFVALRGDRFDGHDFLVQARERGATGAVVARGTQGVSGLALFEVDDTREALGRLAMVRRREVTGPVVAITGSNGKTSTKEMVAGVLAGSYRVHHTRANENNLVGVPLTILGAPDGADCLVVEIGANEQGEVARLREVVQPGIGIVTNVGAAHIEGFGSLATVLTEKVSLLEGVQTAFVGAEPPQLEQLARERAPEVEVIELERSASNVLIRDDGRTSMEVDGVEFVVPGAGLHWASNALFAVAVARRLGVSLADAATRLAGVEPSWGRSELMTIDDLMVLNDCYNSNPASLERAFDTVCAMRRDRRVVLVLGSMLELGSDSAASHDAAFERAAAISPDAIVAVGEFAAAARRVGFAGRLILAEDSDEAGRALAKLLRGDEFVLLKGSRAVRLEKVLDYIDPGG